VLSQLAGVAVLPCTNTTASTQARAKDETSKNKLAMVILRQGSKLIGIFWTH
jgi:3-polyprenyl-4-hydroxybenzoate decarboxylase